MAHSIKISYSACHGCVNCIKSCPTEAIRVINGSITIIKDLCVDCGECLRACARKALGLDDDDWELIHAHGLVEAVPDPTFFAQFGSFWYPDAAKSALMDKGIDLLVDETEDAFDLSAYACARVIENCGSDQLPLISAYCPSVIRLIQLQFPELLSRIIPVENPLEIAAGIWRRRNKSYAPLTLFSPCPAKITLIRDPIGGEPSSIQHVVAIRKVVHTLMASGVKVEKFDKSMPSDWRFATWAIRGGETKHISKFASRELTVLAVSGLRNTVDLLQQLELGRFRGVDFIECRTCDLGCFGGVAAPESRFLSYLRNRHIETEWRLTPERKEELEGLYEDAKLLWRVRDPIQSKQRLPLSSDLSEAMSRMKQMKAIFAELPHIDCGACGRPSCKAMAEDIVREQGEITDCVFKLREGISSLANQILSLADSQPHTLRKPIGKR
jgi:Na+-translocating ferredoxin:NAD+ oxidoreductase RNF subunit RnfB